MSCRRRGIAGLLVALSMGLALPAQAASSAWATSDHANARLFTAVDGTGDLKTVPAGIEIKLDGDWKTYWRSPGDAGLPPALDWTGSSNLAGATLLYPAPKRLTLLGIDTFGYKHDVVFPLDIKVTTPGQPLNLKLKLDILVCAQLCIPKTFDLSLAVPAGPPKPDDDAQLLAKARASVPTDARTAGLRIDSAREVSDKGKAALEIHASADQPFETPDVIAELDPATALTAPRTVLSADRRSATFVLPLSRKLPVGARLTGRKAVVTLIDGERAMEQPTSVTQGASAIEEEPGPSLIAMLGIALLGGLILNLMPCVLPVLSLKFVSVVSQGGRAPAAVRAGFLATAAGIVVSFLVIAGALIGLKAAGQSVGWGLQFQQPAFIAAMAVLVTIFACHLAGLFEVPLPRFIANAASTRTGPDESLAGHFATGAFATLLATPCSAPFLGTAVGFALAGSAPTMLGIFFALGVGLALPYLVIAAVPQLASKMPKPGRWMDIVKKAMALPLVATAIWLVSILATQIGMAASLVVAALLLAIVALLVLRDRLPETRRGLIFPVVAIVGLGTIVLPHLYAAQVRHDAETGGDVIAWKHFDRDHIRSLVSQGKTVFVDVTADWCLTCQANKKFVLANGNLAKRLNDQTISMQADWTRPDPAISSYLAGYGRYGIPFNIVYGPAAPEGIVLPELLTPGDVGAALDKAAGAKAAG